MPRQRFAEFLDEGATCSHKFSLSIVSIRDATNRLNELAREVERGETIVVTRNGRPVFGLVPHHVLAAVEPEALTRDPFDRILLAQCQVAGLRLVTIDRALVSHPMAATLDR